MKEAWRHRIAIWKKMKINDKKKMFVGKENKEDMKADQETRENPL